MTEDQMILERLEDEFLSGPILARTEPLQRFYIRTDRYKYGMGEVLLQGKYTLEAIQTEAQEKYEDK